MKQAYLLNTHKNKSLIDRMSPTIIKTNDSRMTFISGIRHRIRLLLMLLSLLSVQAMAQLYPVQLNAFLIPPYMMHLCDYSTSGETKIQLQLLMTDLMEPIHRIRLSFALESGIDHSLICYTDDVVAGLHDFNLMPGEPLNLTNVDIRPLFELNNLRGISSKTYAEVLPQGMYRFRFQVIDAATRRVLSPPAYATVFLQQYNPPVLTLPIKGEKIVNRNNYQNIVFQWQARQYAPNTHYVFTLRELWDTQSDPTMAFLTSRNLFQQETYSNSLFYGPDRTALLPNHRYGWQVRAISANPALPGMSLPTDDNGVYQNGGYSEIFFFDYVDNCYSPTMLTAKNSGKGKVQLQWLMPTALSSPQYNVQYRKASATGYWSNRTNNTESLTLSGLKDKTEYEYRVGSVCGNLIPTDESGYTYSTLQKFTTDATENAANPSYRCGTEPSISITNHNPLQTALVRNEVFTAGDFPVTVLEAQGSNGTYTGRGYIVVPYLGDTKLKVVFNNIQLNTDRQLIAGVVETTYDAKESNNQFISEGLGETFGDKGTVNTVVNYEIADIKVDSTSTPPRIVITGKDGESETRPMSTDYQITDGKGNIYTVDEKGGVTQSGTVAEGGKPNASNTDGVSGGTDKGSTGTLTAYTAKGIAVAWNFAGSTYAVDDPSKLPDKLRANYPTVKDSNGKETYPVYKAVVNGKTDRIEATITDTNHRLDSGKVVFKTLDGRAIDNTQSGNTYTLTLKGLFNYATEDVTAVFVPQNAAKNQQIIGSFKLVHLEAKTFKVRLVPTDQVSKNELGTLTKNAKAVYNALGITLDIETDNDVFDIGGVVSGDAIPTEPSGTGTYSDVQKQMNAAYKKISNDRYIVFVTGKKASTNEFGYMKLGGQFGYIFSPPSGGRGANTLAHELGHGLFNLEHPFSKYKTRQGETALLMDYADGTATTQLEWKAINDPSLKTIWNMVWQEKSEGDLAGGKFYVAGEVDEEGKPIEFDYDKSECKYFYVDNQWIAKFDDVTKLKDVYIDTKGKLSKVTTTDGNTYKLCSQVETKKDNGQLAVTTTYAANMLINFDTLDADIQSNKPGIKQLVTVAKGLRNGKESNIYSLEKGFYNSKYVLLGVLSQPKRATVGTNIILSDGNTHTCHTLTKCDIPSDTRHTVLFVNGYKFSLPEKEHTAAIKTQDDYWEGIDKSFIEKLDADNVYYADGNMSITTSNHNVDGSVTKSMYNFYCSAHACLPFFSPSLKEDCIKYSSAISKVVQFVPIVGKPISMSIDVANANCLIEGKHLNTTPNTEGFETRKQAGKESSTKLLDLLMQNNCINKNSEGLITDTLDIVCHSMGYAYALGMIEMLKDNMPLGRFYIIAPENAGSGSVNINDWQEVWQYGADLDRKDGQQPDPIEKQDGVAPQTVCGGLDEKNRVYIPASEPKGFITSHSIENYKWIFTQPKHVPNDNGYVEPRK